MEYLLFDGFGDLTLQYFKNRDEFIAAISTTQDKFKLVTRDMDNDLAIPMDIGHFIFLRMYPHMWTLLNTRESEKVWLLFDESLDILEVHCMIKATIQELIVPVKNCFILASDLFQYIGELAMARAIYDETPLVVKEDIREFLLGEIF